MAHMNRGSITLYVLLCIMGVMLTLAHFGNGDEAKLYYTPSMAVAAALAGGSEGAGETGGRLQRAAALREIRVSGRRDTAGRPGTRLTCGRDVRSADSRSAMIPRPSGILKQRKIERCTQNRTWRSLYWHWPW